MKRLVVVGTGPRLYREFMLRRIGERYDVYLVIGRPAEWETPYISGVSVVPGMTTDGIVAAVRDIVARGAIDGAAARAADGAAERAAARAADGAADRAADGAADRAAARAADGAAGGVIEGVIDGAINGAIDGAVDGVMTWAEDHVVDTALAAAAVGLPGPGPGAARACRDKHATRSALAAHGVPQPQSELVADVAEARAVAEKFGYPVVVKPRAGVASEAVALVRDGEELADHFASAQRLPAAGLRSPDRAVMIEEYLTGPEIAVDSVVRDGQVMPVFVSHKEMGFAPYFEETGHWTRGDDPLLGDPAITRFLAQVHEAIGYATGATHTELKLTDEGPKLIEINGRLGGDLLSYLCDSASGVDPGLALAAVSCGDVPDLTRTRALCAGIRFAYPPWHETRVEEIAFDESGLPPEAGLAVPLVRPGEVVLLPHKDLMDGRVAFATAAADSREKLSAALDQALAALRCTWSPA